MTSIWLLPNDAKYHITGGQDSSPAVQRPACSVSSYLRICRTILINSLFQFNPIRCPSAIGFALPSFAPSKLAAQQGANSSHQPRQGKKVIQVAASQVR